MMNSRSCFPIWMSLALFLGGNVMAVERYHIVEVEDCLGESKTEVLSQAELLAKQEDIRQEAQFYMLAMARAQAKWRQEGRKETFPKNNLQQRKVTSMGSFNSKMEAQEKVNRKESREMDAKKEKEEQKKKDGKKDDKDKESAKERKEQERERQLKDALGYYESELAALKAEAEAKKKEKSAP